jgi:hypothetical protein
MFVIFRPIATRNDDVCTRLYPIRLKKYSDSTRQQIGIWILGNNFLQIKQRLLHLIKEERYKESSLEPKQVTRTIGHTAHA